MLTPATIKIMAIGLVVGLSLSFWAGWEWRDRSADLKESKQETSVVKQALTSEKEARQEEHKQADNLAEIGAKHEEDRTKAEAVPAAVVAELRDGSIRLRDGWASCETQRLSQASAAAVERDAATQRREEFASRVVRIGRDADDQLSACQAVIREYTNPNT